MHTHTLTNAARRSAAVGQMRGPRLGLQPRDLLLRLRQADLQLNHLPLRGAVAVEDIERRKCLNDRGALRGDGGKRVVDLCYPRTFARAVASRACLSSCACCASLWGKASCRGKEGTGQSCSPEGGTGWRRAGACWRRAAVCDRPRRRG